jgi:hypothetical protein
VVILLIAWLDEDVEDRGKRVQLAPPGQRDHRIDHDQEQGIARSPR